MSWSPPDVRRQPGSTVLPASAGGQPPRRRDDAVAGAMTAAVMVLLGAPAGLLWSALAPHAHVLAAPPAPASLTDGATEVFIAGDGWFVGITLVLGICSGVLAWLVARRSAPLVLVGLVAGGLLASYVASRVGVRIGQDALKAFLASGRPGTAVANVALQAKSTLVVWPLAAVASFAALVISRVDELR